MVTGERFQQGDRKRKGGEAGGEHSGPGTPPPIIAVAIDSQEEKRKWAGVIIREASSNQREGCLKTGYIIQHQPAALHHLFYKNLNACKPSNNITTLKIIINITLGFH